MGSRSKHNSPQGHGVHSGAPEQKVSSLQEQTCWKLLQFMEGDLLNANQLINTEGGRFQRERQMKQQFAGGDAEGGESSRIAAKAKLLYKTHPADFKAPNQGPGLYPAIGVGTLMHGEVNLVKLWQQVYRKKDLKTL